MQNSITYLTAVSYQENSQEILNLNGFLNFTVEILIKLIYVITYQISFKVIEKVYMQCVKPTLMQSNCYVVS